MGPAMALFAMQAALSVAAAADRHSVVHVMVDDLRPELGAYGLQSAVTPVIDSIAANGTVFDRAYAQQAVCGPSRNSFLSGSTNATHALHTTAAASAAGAEISSLPACVPFIPLVVAARAAHPDRPPPTRLVQGARTLAAAGISSIRSEKTTRSGHRFPGCFCKRPSMRAGVRHCP